MSGTETDVDCGGICGVCYGGQLCSVGSDCESAVCKVDLSRRVYVCDTPEPTSAPTGAPTAAPTPVCTWFE
jgi:hypothetical protein